MCVSSCGHHCQSPCQACLTLRLFVDETNREEASVTFGRPTQEHVKDAYYSRRCDIRYYFGYSTMFKSSTITLLNLVARHNKYNIKNNNMLRSYTSRYIHQRILIVVNSSQVIGGNTSVDLH